MPPLFHRTCWRRDVRLRNHGRRFDRDRHGFVGAPVSRGPQNARHGYVRGRARCGHNLEIEQSRTRCDNRMRFVRVLRPEIDGWNVMDLSHMTIQDANDELCRHRNLALTAYGNRLLAGGADVDDEKFRANMRIRSVANCRNVANYPDCKRRDDRARSICSRSLRRAFRRQMLGAGTKHGRCSLEGLIVVR
jgi:hypothetical protein